MKKLIILLATTFSLLATSHAQQSTYNGQRFIFQEATSASCPAKADAGTLYYRNTDNALCIRNPDGSITVLSGASAGNWTISGTNMFGGTSAGAALTSGVENFFGGIQAGQSTTSGDDNTFIGYQAGRLNTTGINNSFFGNEAGEANTTGSDNTLIGWGAGEAITVGIDNTFVGSLSGNVATTADDNTVVGWAAGIDLTTGAGNVIMGSAACAVTTGSQNISIGAGSFTALTTGSNNTALGASTGAGITSGGNNVFLGSGAGAGSNLSSTIALGAGATTTAANQFVAGSETVPINDFYFGEGVTSTTPAGGVTINATGGSGTNVTGSALYLRGGANTGNNVTGGHIIFGTPTAGGSGTTLQTIDERARVTQNVGNLLIGGTTDPASATKTIVVYSGTAPSGNVTDGISFYSKDFSAGVACPTFRNEAGTEIMLNQSLTTTSSPTFVNATVTSVIVTGKTIDVTAGDGATINAVAGRFRKDNSGAVFTLTNSTITANSIILLEQANAAVDATATWWTVAAGSGTATITFNAAPGADFNMNFLVIN